MIARKKSINFQQTRQLFKDWFRHDLGHPQFNQMKDGLQSSSLEVKACDYFSNIMTDVFAHATSIAKIIETRLIYSKT